MSFPPSFELFLLIGLENIVNFCVHLKYFMSISHQNVQKLCVFCLSYWAFSWNQSFSTLSFFFKMSKLGAWPIDNIIVCSFFTLQLFLPKYLSCNLFATFQERHRLCAWVTLQARRTTTWTRRAEVQGSSSSNHGASNATDTLSRKGRSKDIWSKVSLINEFSVCLWR